MIQHIKIHGKAYVKSNYTILGRDSKFGSLWIANERTQDLFGYRISDGELKHIGKLSQSPRLVDQLEADGQLNWVDDKEEREIEKYMKDISEKFVSDMRKSLRDMDSIIDRKFRDLVEKEWNITIRNVFKRTFEKEFESLNEGVIPIGFKYNPRIPKSKKNQFAYYYLQQLINSQWGKEYSNLIKYAERQGIDLESMDYQNITWIIQETIDENFRSLANEAAPV